MPCCMHYQFAHKKSSRWARRTCFKPNLDDCILGKVSVPLYASYFDKPIFCNKSAGTAFLFTMKSIVLRAT